MLFELEKRVRKTRCIELSKQKALKYIIKLTTNFKGKYFFTEDMEEVFFQSQPEKIFSVEGAFKQAYLMLKEPYYQSYAIETKKAYLSVFWEKFD